MQCIFVLDILNGAVVHAVKGERARYEPIQKHSRIVDSSDPVSILEQIKPKNVYVADLNRLMGLGDNLRVLEAISLKADTMADAGISEENDLSYIPKKAVPVIGTETASLKLMKATAVRRPVVVSIDVKFHRVLTCDPHLAGDPLDVLLKLDGLPLEAVIVLELDRVGTYSGIDGGFLAEMASASSHPLIFGGGIRGPGDLRTLESLGFESALVATAIHYGSLPLETIR